MSEFLGNLGYAPVVVGIFQGLGDAFLLKVEGDVTQGGIFRDTVVVGIGGGGLHGLEGALIVEAGYVFEDHVGEYGAGVVAYHAPCLAAVERPVGEHVFGALVVVGEHRIGYVGLEGPVHQVHQRLEGPERIPEGECCHVGEAFGIADGTVVLAETAVEVLEHERVLHGAVDAGVESLSQHLVVGVQ